MIFLLVLFVVVIVIPFISVAFHAENISKVISTLRSYHNSILTTSLLAGCAALVSTALALPIGFHLARSHNRATQILDIICWIPIAIPGTIFGLGLIGVSNWVPSVRNADSFGVLLLISYIGMFSAFSVRILQTTYKQADPNIDEALALEDCRWYQRLLHIDLPIHSGAIAASFIIVFVLSVGELNATVLLVPPGKETLAVTIDNLLHYGANVNASVLCLTEAVLVVLVMLAGLAVWYFALGKKK